MGAASKLMCKPLYMNFKIFGRVTLSNIVNGHTGISPEMAVRLSIALNTSSEMWMNMQSAYDLWQAKQSQKVIMKQVTVINSILGVSSKKIY